MRAVKLKVRPSKSQPGKIYAQVSDIDTNETLFTGWVDDAIKQCVCRMWTIRNDANEFLKSLALLGVNFIPSERK